MNRRLATGLLCSVLFFQASSVASAATVLGNGTGDNTAAIQSAVDACQESCRIDLKNVVVATPVNLPSNATITFQADGPVKVTAAVGFKRASSAKASIANRLVFDGITFDKANEGMVIQDSLNFSSSGNQGITVTNSFFNLSGGAVGVALSGSDFNLITGNVFNSDATSVALEAISAAGISTTTMVSTVADNQFRLGTAFKNLTVAGSDGLEGWTFTGNHLWSSAISIKSGNSINFVGNEFVSSHFTIDNVLNSNIQSNYFDDGTAGTALLTVTSASGGVQAINIEGNYFDRHDTPGAAILFSGGLPGRETSGINLVGNTYIGGANTRASGNPSYGIVFDDPTIRNVYIGAENFRAVYACIYLKQMLDKSTIDRFEARDVIYYALGIQSNRGRYLRSDYLYRTFPMKLTGAFQSPSTKPQILSTQTVVFPEMFAGPLVTTSPGKGGCSSYTAWSADQTSPGSISVDLIQNPGAASPGAVFCQLIITLDATAYIPPR